MVIRRKSVNFVLIALVFSFLIGSVSAALTDGLEGYWPMDETNGTTANDFSGHDRNGAISGGVTVNRTGKVGKAMLFDGSTEKISVTNYNGGIEESL